MLSSGHTVATRVLRNEPQMPWVRTVEETTKHVPRHCPRPVARIVSGSQGAPSGRSEASTPVAPQSPVRWLHRIVPASLPAVPAHCESDVHHGKHPRLSGVLPLRLYQKPVQT